VEPKEAFGVFATHRIKTERVMPSSEYYRRQADMLLMLALNATDPELSARYRTLALQYKMLAATYDSVPSGAAGIGDLSSVADEREAD
jgi:hypothetical protein